MKLRSHTRLKGHTPLESTRVVHVLVAFLIAAAAVGTIGLAAAGLLLAAISSSRFGDEIVVDIGNIRTGPQRI